jgi:hypothetical protein
LPVQFGKSWRKFAWDASGDQGARGFFVDDELAPARGDFEQRIELKAAHGFAVAPPGAVQLE